MSNLKKTNQKNKTGIFEMYVYKYNHNGKDLFYYVDDVDGDILVSDINNASLFTEKQIKQLELDAVFDIGDEIYCEIEGGYITLSKKLVKIKILNYA